MPDLDHRTIVLAAGSMLDHPDATLVDAAAEVGFDAVGLRIPGHRRIDDLGATREHAARRGIRVHDTEVYRVGAGAPDPGRLIEQTCAVGAPSLLAVSDVVDRAVTVGALTAVAERCRAAGLRLALEYMAWTMPSDPLDAIAIAEEVGCEIVVDLLHHVRVGAGADELDAVVESGRLGWIQVCDAIGAPRGGANADLIHEARHTRLPPGAGALPIGRLLRRVPTDVTISVEVQSDALRKVEPTERARRLLDATRSVLGEPHVPSSTG